VIASYLGFAQKEPERIGGKNYFSRKGAKTQKKTSEPLREKCPRQKTLFVQSRYLAYEAIRRHRRRRDDGYNFSHHRFFWKEFLTPKAQK
jgi:hypothetical protein